jgi:hypothetical protein
MIKQCLRRMSRRAEAEPLLIDQRRPTMKTRVAKYLGALGLGVVLALTAATSSFAQRHDPNCIPQYDSSGAQTAPYC